MSAAALLAELRAAGAELTIDPQGIRFRAPRPLPAALLARARTLKPELRALLEPPVDLAQLGHLEAPGPELPADVAPTPAASAALPVAHPDTPEGWGDFLDSAPWVGPAERLRILADVCREAPAAPPPFSPQAVAALPDWRRDFYEERAAILEYDGGQDRQTAEREAYAAALAQPEPEPELAVDLAGAQLAAEE